MYPHNLISKLPNLLGLARPLDLSFSNKDSGFVYSMMGGGGSAGMSNPAGIGFDWSCTNKSGVKITVAVDGVEYTILDGEIKSITNTPFDRFEIIDSTGATSANSIDVILLGMDLSKIVALTETPAILNVWE